MSGRGKITGKAERFVLEYLRDCNAAQAAIRAGYSAKGAKVQGHRLMKRPEIAAQIAAHAAKVAQGPELTPERVRRELARIAFADPRKLYDENGNLRPVHELDDDTAAAVAAIEHEELFEGRGRDREQVGTVRKLKQWDKNKALDIASRVLGMAKDPLPFAFAGGLTIIIDENAEPWRDRDAIQATPPHLAPDEFPVRRLHLGDAERGERTPEPRPFPPAPEPRPTGEVLNGSAPVPRYEIED
jgi:phage terminase small subunit